VVLDGHQLRAVRTNPRQTTALFRMHHSGRYKLPLVAVAGKVAERVWTVTPAARRTALAGSCDRPLGHGMASPALVRSARRCKRAVDCTRRIADWCNVNGMWLQLGSVVGHAECALTKQQ